MSPEFLSECESSVSRFYSFLTSLNVGGTVLSKTGEMVPHLLLDDYRLVFHVLFLMTLVRTCFQFKIYSGGCIFVGLKKELIH